MVSIFYLYYFSSLYLLKIILVSCRQCIFFFLSYNILALFPSLLIFAHLSLMFCCCFFSSTLFQTSLYTLSFTLFCLLSSLFYLCFRFYFLPLFSWFLIPTYFSSFYTLKIIYLLLLKLFFSRLIFFKFFFHLYYSLLICCRYFCQGWVVFFAAVGLFSSLFCLI